MQLPIDTLYLIIHGITTVGGVFLFLIRTEHRITKLEEGYRLLRESHDTLTKHGTFRHIF